MSDKVVIHIKVAEESEPGKYYLILSRGSSMFGGGGSITYSIDGIFAQEDSGGRALYFKAWQSAVTNVVAMFPLSANFTVVRKEQVSRMTSEEAAKKQKAEEEALDKIFGKESSLGPEIPEDAVKGYL